MAPLEGGISGRGGPCSRGGRWWLIGRRWLHLREGCSDCQGADEERLIPHLVPLLRQVVVQRHSTAPGPPELKGKGLLRPRRLMHLARIIRALNENKRKRRQAKGSRSATLPLANISKVAGAIFGLSWGKGGESHRGSGDGDEPGRLCHHGR